MKEMENTEGQQTNPQSVQATKEERLQSMIDLTKKFGGSGLIPEEDLTAIGYVRRISEDGMVRLMPVERFEELAQKDPDWEKPLKNRELPFGRIAVELPTSERSFRFIPGSQRQLLSERLQAVESVLYPTRNWDNDIVLGPLDLVPSRLHNLRTFVLDFLNSLDSLKIFDEEISEDDVRSGVIEFILGTLSDRGDPELGDPNEFSHREFQMEYSGMDGSVSSPDSRQMFDELTRLGGYYTDQDELEKSFRDNLKKETLSPGRRENEPELTHFLEKQGILTYADFIQYAFPRYLEFVGLPEIGEAVAAAPQLDTIANKLQQKDISDNSRTAEQELRRALKTATPDERNVLSKRLKELEDAKKKRKQIRLGVIDYFSSSNLYIDVVRRRIKETQDFLISGRDQKGHDLFYLDATPNEELDKDPGVVSGDCTIGKPLPFDRQDLPIYNVKVFAEGDQHVGNLYLLVTNTSSRARESRKVWHFDAMQVPRSGINWKEGIVGMVGVLAKEAEQKGVDAITANSEIHHISNYDYIAHAVESYWGGHGRQIVRVTIPEVNDSDHSSLQGTGQAIVLWSKEKLSEPYGKDLESDEELFNAE